MNIKLRHYDIITLFIDHKKHLILYFGTNNIVEAFNTIHDNSLDYMLLGCDEIEIKSTSLFYDDLMLEYKGYELIKLDTRININKSLRELKLPRIESLLQKIEEPMLAGVYKISNNTLGFAYIGSTKCFKTRLDGHFKQDYVGRSNLMHKDTTFEVLEIIEGNNKDQLLIREEYYIQNATDSGLLNKNLQPYTSKQ